MNTIAHITSPWVDRKRQPPYPQRPLPRKPKVKPGRDKALTLAAGFRCRGGIILCADSEITRSGILKVPGNKILTAKHGGVSLAVTGAGDWSYVQMTFQKIADKFDQLGDPDLTLPAIQQIIEQTILGVYDTFVSVDRENPAFTIIAATRTTDEELNLLFSHQSPTVVRCDGFDCTGAGEILASYLADIFYEPDSSINRGVFLAAYVLRLAKTYVSGVGGRSDILLMTPDGEMRFQRRDFVKDLEGTFERFDAILNPILFSLPDIHLPEDQFDEKLADFNTKIRGLRQQLKEGHKLDFLSELDDLLDSPFS